MKKLPDANALTFSPKAVALTALLLSLTGFSVPALASGSACANPPTALKDGHSGEPIFERSGDQGHYYISERSCLLIVAEVHRGFCEAPQKLTGSLWTVDLSDVSDLQITEHSNYTMVRFTPMASDVLHETLSGEKLEGYEFSFDVYVCGAVHSEGDYIRTLTIPFRYHLSKSEIDALRTVYRRCR